MTGYQPPVFGLSDPNSSPVFATNDPLASTGYPAYPQSPDPLRPQGVQPAYDRPPNYLIAQTRLDRTKIPFLLERKIRLHLGYNHPKSLVDLYEYQFLRALNTIASSFDIHASPGGLYWWCQYLDTLLDATNPFTSKGFSARQAIAGDISRTTITINAKDHRLVWVEFYYQESERFGSTISVVSLVRPERKQMIYMSTETSAVPLIKGPPDTCVSDRLYLSANCV